MKRKLVRQITDNALIAALYYISTIILGDRAFMDVQFRFAEMLIFLVYFRKDFVIGVTVGCLLANIHSPLLPWDLVFGTFATFMSALLVARSKHMVMGIIYPAIINGVVVGTMLHFILATPLIPSMALVFLGEFIILILGYVLAMMLKKNDLFLRMILADPK